MKALFKTFLIFWGLEGLVAVGYYMKGNIILKVVPAVIGVLIIIIFICMLIDVFSKDD